MRSGREKYVVKKRYATPLNPYFFDVHPFASQMQRFGTNSNRFCSFRSHNTPSE